MNWLTTEAVEVLEIVELPVEDRQQEYMVSNSYSIANRSLYHHMVYNVPVSCKANRVGNRLYSDLIVIVYQWEMLQTIGVNDIQAT